MRIIWRILTSLLLVAISLLPAHAGDAAQRNIIGYSADSRYFAFEEFGVQDGSGFAYSKIFLIDLHLDKWVDGGPFSHQASDEGETLRAVRAASLAQAQPFLIARDISVPGITLTGAPLGAVGVDPHRLAFGPLGFSNAPPSPEDAQLLSLDLLTVPSGSDCDFTDGFFGYQLSWTDAEGEVKILHKDSRIPSSRSCPVEYRISEVILPFGTFTLENAVVLISVFSYGFEGPDRRFIAVPLNQ